MKIIFISLIIFSITSAKAQLPPVFDAGVAFNSICCGPPDESFLKAFMSCKDYKLIKAYKAAGCGREGEFRVLFSFKGVKPSLAKKFLKRLKNKVIKQDAINKSKNTSSGNLEVLQNIKKEELDNCRSGIIPWKK